MRSTVASSGSSAWAIPLLPTFSPAGEKNSLEIRVTIRERAEADGIAVVFVLRSGMAEVDAGSPAGSFFGETLAD